jgi:hypothetical protein
MRARPSQRPYNVEYYRRNRDLELQRVRVRQAGMVELLRDLRRVPCADCGQQFKPYQMDFDHRDPTTKAFNVMTGRAMLMSTAKVLAEVAKCDIVCVNCHRLRTRDVERNRVRRNSRHRRRSPGWSVGVFRPACSTHVETYHAPIAGGDSMRAPWTSTTGTRARNASR